MRDLVDRIVRNRSRILPLLMAYLLLNPVYAVRNLFGRIDWFVMLFRAPVVRRFNRLYYLLRKNTFDSTYFLGKHVLKFPTDLWSYQEIIYDRQPDVIVETGVFLGGSTFFYAKLLELIGGGRVISVDTTLDHADPDLAALKNVTLIEGSSTDPAIIERIRGLIQPHERVMVILDSDHAADHVYRELCLYCDLVSEGQYLIVEDGLIEKVYPPFQRRGPARATRRFLRERDGFQVDHRRTRFLLTQNPGGYLLKTSSRDTGGARESDNLRPLRLWLPFTKAPTDMNWLGLLDQNKSRADASEGRGDGRSD